jgi:hypothetical protein
VFIALAHHNHYDFSSLTDTEKRQYLTLKVNALFSVKRSFSNERRDIKKGLPTENGEESCLVAGVGEISNFDLVKDMTEVIVFLSD